jgi:hypothetical protein
LFAAITKFAQSIRVNNLIDKTIDPTPNKTKIDVAILAEHFLILQFKLILQIRKEIQIQAANQKMQIIRIVQTMFR